MKTAVVRTTAKCRYSGWIAALVLMTVAAYLPVFQNDFVNWDDPLYVTGHSRLHTLDWETFRAVWSTTRSGNWIPLTWLSHALDVHWFGLNPAGHHGTSLLFHVLNTLLVFFLVLKIYGHGMPPGSVAIPSAPASAGAEQAAWLAAALFALHPTHVESVAWISERKDLLCAFFYLGGLVAYLPCSGHGPTRSRPRLGLAFLCMVLAVLCKPMAVTFPLALLALDAYPLSRFRRGSVHALVIEKIPFFLLALVIAGVTFSAQGRSGALASLDRFPLDYRLLNALRGYAFYWKQWFWPHPLSPLYPLPDPQLMGREWQTWVAVLGHGVLLAVLIRFFRKGSPAIWAALAYFYGTLFPVSGIVQTGVQGAADRYLYLPSLSLCLLAAEATRRFLFGKTGSGIAGRWVLPVLILGALGILTYRQTGVWRDSESLWRHAIRHYPGQLFIAHLNYGTFLEREGRLEEALDHYRKSLRVSRNNPQTHFNMGNVLRSLDRREAAAVCYRQALDLDPNWSAAWYNLALVHQELGRYAEAVELYGKALALEPTMSLAHYNRGNAYYHLQRIQEAREAYLKALALDPKARDTHFNLGIVSRQLGDLEGARRYFEHCLHLRPGDKEAYFQLQKTLRLIKPGD